jgi:hypothetical protein
MRMISEQGEGTRSIKAEGAAILNRGGQVDCVEKVAFEQKPEEGESSLGSRTKTSAKVLRQEGGWQIRGTAVRPVWLEGGEYGGEGQMEWRPGRRSQTT